MEKDFIENWKNAHTNFDALSEAEFMERRMVFMGEEAPAGDAPAEGAPVGPEAPAEDGGESEATEAQKQTDGINFILDRLEVPANPTAGGIAIPKLADIKIEEVTYGSDKTTVESVKASYRNIETTIKSDTPKEDLEKFTEFAKKLEDGKYDAFVFLEGSSADIENKKILLKIGVKETLAAAAAGESIEPPLPDSLELSISLDDGKITEAKLISGEQETVLEDLATKTLDEIDIVKLREIAVATDADVDAALAEAAPEPLKGDETITPNSYKDKFKEAFKALGRGRSKKDVLNHTFLIQEDDGKQVATVKFEHLNTDGNNTLVITRVGTDHKETKYQISKPDKKSEKYTVKIGDRKLVEDCEVSVSGDGMLVIKNSVDEMPVTHTVDILNHMQKVSAGASGQIIETGLISMDAKRPARLSVRVSGEDKILMVDKDGDIHLVSAEEAAAEGADGGAAEGGDKGKDKKERGAMERIFGPGAGENVSSFMETFEELIATVLEILASLGFDLNPDKDKDGTERTPEQKASRRLQLFVGKNQLGMKNIGKLKDTTVKDLLGGKDSDGNTSDGYYVEDNQASTIVALGGAGFDTEGVHGEKMYDVLTKIHERMDENAHIKTYRDENPDMDLNTFLFDTDMIDMTGGWSNKYKKFDGKTAAEKADEAVAAATVEATKAQERTSLKNDTTLKPEVMKRIVNADDSKERDELATKLLSMEALEQTDVDTYNSSGKTPDAFRTLLLTMTPDHKEEFFGGDQAVEKGWRDVMKDVKTRLTKIEAGKTDAGKVAEYLTKSDTEFKVGEEKITFSNKGKLTVALNKTVKSFDGKRFIKKGEDEVDPELTEAKFGIREDEIQTLFEYLHEPEGGKYTGEKVALRREYDLPSDSPYTLADLMVAVFDIKLEEAPAP